MPQFVEVCSHLLTGKWGQRFSIDFSRKVRESLLVLADLRRLLCQQLLARPGLVQSLQDCRAFADHGRQIIVLKRLSVTCLRSLQALYSWISVIKSDQLLIFAFVAPVISAYFC